MAEAEDLKSSQCGFDPHSGHQVVRKFCTKVFKAQAKLIEKLIEMDRFVT
jgi:hypothetical protein